MAFTLSQIFWVGLWSIATTSVCIHKWWHTVIFCSYFCDSRKKAPATVSKPVSTRYWESALMTPLETPFECELALALPPTLGFPIMCFNVWSGSQQSRYGRNNLLCYSKTSKTKITEIKCNDPVSVKCVHLSHRCGQCNIFILPSGSALVSVVHTLLQTYLR